MIAAARRATPVIILVGLCAALLPRTGRAQPPSPSFTSRAELVRLEVSVRRGDTAVEGLTTADFEVRDNGVPQTVLNVQPLRGAHVILAIDVSGSVEGSVLAQEKEAVLEVLSRLTPADRASVVAFADEVRVLARVSSAGALLGADVAPLVAGGGTALHDALIVATSLARADERPAVVLLFTDGGDSSSWASAQRALDHLRRHDAVVVPIVPPAGRSGPSRGSDSTLDPLAHRFWVAASAADSERLLDQAARITGGDVVTASASARLLDTFAGVLERYRQRYVLSFEPTGVARDDGWHRLTVRVPGQRVSITARDGYWADGR